MSKPKVSVAVVRITNSLKSVIPLLLAVPESASYCAVMWNEDIITGCFDYFGTENDLESYSVRVKHDTSKLGFRFIDTFPDYAGMPATSYGGLVDQNVKALLKVSPIENVLAYADNCLAVARRRLRSALTNSDIDFAMADCDKIMSSIAYIKLGQAVA